jgi:hypothetical protein
VHLKQGDNEIKELIERVGATAPKDR